MMVLPASLKNAVDVRLVIDHPIFVGGMQDIVCEAETVEDCPTDFTIQGSHTGEEWEDIPLEQTEETGWHRYPGNEAPGCFYLALSPRKPITKLTPKD